MQKHAWAYVISFIEGEDPTPTPGGGSDFFNTLTQTGD